MKKNIKILYHNVPCLDVCGVEFYIPLRSNETRGVERDDDVILEER